MFSAYYNIILKISQTPIFKVRIYRDLIWTIALALQITHTCTPRFQYPR